MNGHEFDALAAENAKLKRKLHFATRDLRDRFATAALQGLVTAHFPRRPLEENLATFASLSYSLADAMLKQRNVMPPAADEVGDE